MIVHRFMSEQEFALLMYGKSLRNTTDHHRKYKRRTTSRGFCFFTEDPDEAVHWLSGIVDLDLCVTMEVPDDYLIQSYGIYMDDEGSDLSHPMNYEELMRTAKFKKRTEYCRSCYSLGDVKVIDFTDKYYHMYPPRYMQQALLAALLRGERV